MENQLEHCFLAMFSEDGKPEHNVMFPSHIGVQIKEARCTNLETFFLAIFLDGGKTSKHGFQTMFPEDGKPEHCFL